MGHLVAIEALRSVQTGDTHPAGMLSCLCIAFGLVAHFSFSVFILERYIRIKRPSTLVGIFMD